MRSKEEAHDYRYFPDPDLLPLELDPIWVENIKKSLPELPDEKKARLMQAGLSAYDASVLVAEREIADYFEAMVGHGADAKAAANWLNNEYFGRLNKAGLSITEGPVSAQANAEIVAMVAEGLISGKIAKDVLDIEWAEKTGTPRTKIVEARGMKQVTDTSAIDASRKWRLNRCCCL
jgi:aspartyl-tRNA(Asn)/glutamyl-tRNA(Gln) amidotransferase subunit B